MSQITLTTHMLIIGDIGTMMAVVLGAGALSSLGSAFSAGLAAFLKKRKGVNNLSVKLPDGTEVKFNNTMSQQEISQKLGSISANVQSALHTPAKRPE